MRRKIKLSGRVDIPLNAFDIKPTNNNDSLVLEVLNNRKFLSLDQDAAIILKLNENKRTEFLDFGSLREPRFEQQYYSGSFKAPSCQLRVVSKNPDKFGIVLGSTVNWTMQVSGDSVDESAGKGILMFQPMDIAPRTWKLEIRDDEHPVLYVDSNIPEATDWAKRDPVFLSTALPSVVERVLNHIITHPDNKEFEWASQWLQWAQVLSGGEEPPIGDDDREREAWVDSVVDAFCRKHEFLQKLIGYKVESEKHELS